MAENINISFAPNKSSDEIQRISDIENYLQTLTERTKFALASIIENAEGDGDDKSDDITRRMMLQAISDSVGRFTNDEKNSEIFNNYYGNIASGDYSHAEGSYTKATGDASHAEGDGSEATGRYSHAEGNSRATNWYSHGEGGHTIASGDSSHAEGRETQATEQGSHSEGGYTQATNWYSHAEGYYTVASGDYSHAEGIQSEAQQTGSHAEGSTTIASGYSSHAEGVETTSSGDCSHAEGSVTQATGSYSHAEGSNTIASGTNAHTEGYGTKANQRCTHAEGDNTIASAEGAHAEGFQTEASGTFSHTQNWGTVAENYCNTAIGKFNEKGKDLAFVIGNGTSDNSRSNAMEFDWEGNLHITGRFTADGGFLIDIPVATSDTLGGVIIGDNITVADDGTISVDLSSYLKSADISAWAKQPNKPVYTADEVGAATEQHTHSTADITDFPAIPTKVSELQNDSGYLSTETDPTVPAWAKADTKPTYTAAEVGAAKSVHTHAQSDITGLESALASKANTSHTHQKSDITDMPTSLKNPNALTVQFNGTTNQTYDGSVAKTVNITPAGIGAATEQQITDAKNDCIKAIGEFNSTKGEIVLDIGSDNVMATALHEVTHYIKVNAYAEYTALCNFIIEYATRTGKIEEYLNAYTNGYKIDNVYALTEEMTADAAEALIQSDKFVEDIFNDPDFINAIAEEKQGIVRKFIDALKSIVEAIKNYLKNGDVNHRIAAQLAQDVEALEQYEKLWVDALHKATRNHIASNINLIDTSNGEGIQLGNEDGFVPKSDYSKDAAEYIAKKNSTSTMYTNQPKVVFSKTGKGYVIGKKNADYKGILKGMYDRNILTSAQKNKYDEIMRKKGNDKYLRSFDITGEQILKYLLSDENGNMSKESQQMLKDLKRIADLMKEAAKNIKLQVLSLDDVNNAQIYYNPKTGEVNLSAMVKNGDYPINFDFTTICKKRVNMQAIVDRLIENAKADSNGEYKVNLSQENLLSINKALSKEGYETACLGCFVESKRYNINAWATSFVEKWNSSLEKAIGKKAASAKGYLDFAKGNMLQNESDIDDEAISKLIEEYKSESKNYKENLAEVKKGKGGKNLTNEEKIKSFIITHPEFQGKLQLSDIITSSGIENLSNASTEKARIYPLRLEL